MISSNLSRADRKSRFLIQIETEIGKSSGLLFDSVVMTGNVATILRSLITRAIGHIDMMADIDKALRHSLSL
jgi:mRNA interferase MazF